jgi:hypothetical protein
MLITYHGSCHCSAIRFEADIDFAGGTGRCNCTFCVKTRAWGVILKPAAFRLDPASSHGIGYRKHEQAPLKYHCETCGVLTYSRGNADYLGGPFVTVFVSTLDDASPEVLLSGPVNYSNGRDNDWRSQPKEVRHL